MSAGKANSALDMNVADSNPDFSQDVRSLNSRQDDDMRMFVPKINDQSKLKTVYKSKKTQNHPNKELFSWASNQHMTA